MRIISSFKDYYDCIQGQGQDQTLMYIREPEAERINSGHYRPGYSDTWLGYETLDFYTIGFCGKIYLMMKYKDKCFHTPEKIDEFIQSSFKKKDVDDYAGSVRYRWNVRSDIKFNQKSLYDTFKNVEESKDKYSKLMLERKTPVFVIRRKGWRENEIIWNACLKDYGFQKMFDPFAAYQEIAMYMGKIARPERPIPAISNEDMIEIKGFDSKSFRQAAPGKKERRRNKKNKKSK